MVWDKPYRPFILLLLIAIAISVALAAVATTVPSKTAPEITVPVDRDRVALGHYLQVFVDKTNQLSVAAVRALPEQEWAQVTAEYPAFGFSPHAHWLRLPIANPHPELQSLVIELAFALHDDVDFYYFRQGELVQQVRAGNSVADYRHSNVHRNFAFPLRLQSGEAGEIYLRIKSTASIQAPLVLWQQSAFYEDEHRYFLFHGMFFGMALLLIFYNAMLYVEFRAIRYLLYVFSVTGIVVSQLAFTGVGFQFVWPNHPGWGQAALHIFGPLTLVSYFLFLRSILNLSALNAALDRLAWLIIVGAGLYFFINPFLGTTFRTSTLAAMAVAAGLAAMVISYSAWHISRKRHVASIAVASTAYLLSLIYLGAEGLNLLPIGRFSDYAVPVGSGIEMFLLSYALTQQWRDISQQKVVAEHRLAETNERLLGLERQQSAMLEQQVQQRTKDLDQRTQDLQLALSNVEALNEQLARLSITDQLTGAKNRRYFDERLDQEIKRAQRGHSSVSLVLIDLDHFKKVNDSYGHQGGDECLRRVVQIITEQLRPASDAVCRYGGEELALILADTNLADAVQVAERIRLSIEAAEIQSGEHRFKVTASFGVAGRVPDSTSIAQSWLEVADSALYAAKRQGRNQVVSQAME